MKTAVVHDWLNGMRGGEKVLEAMLPLLENPTIYTLFYTKGSVSPEIEKFPIRASALNRLPLARNRYRDYLPLFPRAVESFDLSGYDLVVSSSHCVAKGAVAPTGVPHLCYCHTPVRYAYDQFEAYFPEGRTRWRGLKKWAIDRLRAWDIATAGRPDRYLANSRAVAGRIRTHYGREATVCHPPVDVAFFCPANVPRGDGLLAVGALVPYKRFEEAIAAAARASRRLTIVGRGPEGKRLRALAGPSVNFVSDLAPENLRDLYRRSAALLQPGEEDFGIAAVEALACGAPVVALARGGVCDIVQDGVEGVLYDELQAGGLAAALARAADIRFDYNRLRETAMRFSPERFREGFGLAVTTMRQSPDHPITRSPDSP
jgi:glycosyltransferase involved in cell wall biosynthesis